MNLIKKTAPFSSIHTHLISYEPKLKFGKHYAAKLHSAKTFDL